ncbi:phosphoribosylformylglycinamidine synthase I [Candidatus Uhrbacteria bacterium]|nr:phosphoribosylformylglycinamidine synthase I [Candidatus Uhrbacteria bacterium]
MNIAIIQFPGSNCEAESIRAVRAAGMDAEEFLWNRNPSDLSSCDGYFIVGGFSYEDRSRAGIIASLDPIMKYLRGENEKGKPILGVCNGAQILVEAGFVPGCKDYQPGLALATNKRVKHGQVLGTGFYNAWVTLKLDCEPESSAFTCAMPREYLMRVPIAHAEGRFVIDDSIADALHTTRCLAFRYSTPTGQQADEFPINPNGSALNLAGIINPAGTVLAMMPHPERSADGFPLFKSMQRYLTSRKGERKTGEIPCAPNVAHIPQFEPDKGNAQLLIESTITDNEAFTVETTLRSLGKKVKVKRLIHWEYSTEPDHSNVERAVVSSGELFNANKERIVGSGTKLLPAHAQAFLVRYRHDSIGEQTRQTLLTRHGIRGIRSLAHGIVWILEPDPDAANTIIDDIIATHILHNRYSQDCYRYQL